MGCGCGKNKRKPVPVSEDTPDPNESPSAQGDAWWQANPNGLPPTAAVPMPS